jgi:hypothetical protein
MWGVRVAVASEERPPFEVDAVAVEDDTYGVLAADPEFREPDEHPIRIWTQVHEMTPAEPGSVSVAGGHPLRLLAVVHDLSEDPTWREEWVARAVTEILAEVARRRLCGLGLSLLGAVHGRFPVRSFLEIVRAALEQDRPPTLDRLWLITPPERADELTGLLAEITR